MDIIETLLTDVQFLQSNLVLKQLLVVFIYGLLAKIADLVIDKVLMRMARRTKVDIDEKIIPIVHGPICWTIFAIGILHALLLREMVQPWQMVLPALIKTTITLAWLFAFLKIMNELARQHVGEVLLRGKIGSDFFNLSRNLLRVVVVILGVVGVLSIWQVNLTPIFASAGIAGIAIALAAKDTLANFFGGISIFMDKTFKVGDYIIIDSGERGEVVEVGIRSTRIKTRDDVLITIPNAILANSKIINESAPQPRFRIRVPIGVAYGSDLAEVQRVLLEVALANPNVAQDPAPRVRLRSFGASSVDFQLLLWVSDPRLKGRETHNLLLAIYEAFDAGGINIPFPQLNLHINKLPPSVSAPMKRTS